MRYLTLLLALLLTAETGEAQTLELIPETGDYALTYTDLDGFEHTVVVEPRNKVDPVMDVSVTSTEAETVYRYVLQNRASPQAKQPISAVRLPCPDRLGAVSVGAAEWNSRVVVLRGETLCHFLFRSDWLVPGGRRQSFEVRSTWMPGIVEGRILGAGEPVLWPTEAGSFDDRVYALADQVRGITGGWFSLPVVAPARDPAEMADPVRALPLISADLEKACELSWITNAGVCRSLAAKLEQTSRSLSRGQRSAAQGQLRAFLRELEAQRGRHVDPNAYALLATNVRYLLDHLD